MKRIITITLAFAIIFSFAACGKGSSQDGTSTTGTPAGRLSGEFRALLVKDSSASAESLAASLSQLDWLPFSGASMSVEPGYLNGFTAEITGFDEGAVFAPVIGSIPFIGYVFKVSGDTEGFMELLKASHDLRWNVCTQADEMVCENVGDTVFFVMSPVSFED